MYIRQNGAELQAPLWQPSVNREGKPTAIVSVRNHPHQIVTVGESHEREVYTMTRITRTTLVLISTLLMGLLALSCGSDKGGGPTEPPPFSILHLDLYGAAELSSAYVYQVWGAEIDTTTTIAAALGTWTKVIAFRAVPSGTGTATITSVNNVPFTGNDLTGISGDLDDYDTMLVTIEPANDIPNTPGGSPYLGAGIPRDLTKSVTAGFHFPLEIDVNNGLFYLATPTDNVVDNDTSGIWFIKFGAPETAGLVMADAPAGWKYEGWVEHGGTWLSTGKFTSVNGVDESDQYSGLDNPPPPFPGEDFLRGATGLPWVMHVEDTVLVTLEPSPDFDDDSQFTIRLLATQIARPDGVNEVSIGYNYSIVEWPVNSFPNAVAVFKRADQ